MDTKSRGTILIFSLDALGHINPILSIMKELHLRGYRVVLITTGPMSAAPKLKAMGYELDYCYDPKEKNEPENSDKIVAILTSMLELFRHGPRKTFEATYGIEGAVGRYLNETIAHHSEIEAKLRSYNPDLIVVDHVSAVPCATVVAPRWVRLYSGFPLVPYSCYNENCVAGMGLKLDEMTSEMKEFEVSVRKPVREKTRKFVQECGVADWPSNIDLVPTSPYLNLYLGPEELGLEKVQRFKPLPSTWFRIEHTIDESNPNSFELPESIKSLQGKLIYFSLGTLVSSDVKLLNRLLEMLSDSPNKFIISMGKMHEQIKLFPNMWGSSFIDQKAVLPLVDLFITHGGHNSIVESFYYGVPGLLVLPIFADQFDSAQRIEDCGFGYRINPYECTKEELLKSIDIILVDEQMKERMKRASKRLQSIKYHEIAADKLEAILKSKS